jgi:signal transduction histidine kinase
MKQKLIRLSRRYTTALRKHLQQGRHGNLQEAVDLGRRAVDLGLETLELARIHERAIATLELASSKNGFIKQAEIFFIEAIVPIVGLHSAARRNKVDLKRLREMLDQRTAELAAANRLLKHGRAGREGVEAALKQNDLHYNKLLKDSLAIQAGLRRLAHKVLSAQEAERTKISHELQDEIAQTLLGINVRLITLKQEARTNTKGLKNEIASTQQLVVKSAKSVRRAARGIGRQPQS